MRLPHQHAYYMIYKPVGIAMTVKVYRSLSITVSINIILGTKVLLPARKILFLRCPEQIDVPMNNHVYFMYCGKSNSTPQI